MIVTGTPFGSGVCPITSIGDGICGRSVGNMLDALASLKRPVTP